MLAEAYIRCATDNTGEFHAAGAALAGSDEKATVFEALLNNCVHIFVAVLRPLVSLAPQDLELRCIGLVSAGEALSAALILGGRDEKDVIGAFASLIKGALQETS